jgi:hypothetical protein
MDMISEVVGECGADLLGADASQARADSESRVRSELGARAVAGW